MPERSNTTAKDSFVDGSGDEYDGSEDAKDGYDDFSDEYYNLPPDILPEG